MKQEIHQEFTFLSHINLIIKPFSSYSSALRTFCRHLWAFKNEFRLRQPFFPQEKFLFSVSFPLNSDLIPKKISMLCTASTL